MGFQFNLGFSQHRPNFSCFGFIFIIFIYSLLKQPTDCFTYYNDSSQPLDGVALNPMPIMHEDKKSPR